MSFHGVDLLTSKTRRAYAEIRFSRMASERERASYGVPRQRSKPPKFVVYDKVNVDGTIDGDARQPP